MWIKKNDTNEIYIAIPYRSNDMEGLDDYQLLNAMGYRLASVIGEITWIPDHVFNANYTIISNDIAMGILEYHYAQLSGQVPESTFQGWLASTFNPLMLRINAMSAAQTDLAVNVADLSANVVDLVAMKSSLSNPNLLINADFRNPVNQRADYNYWKPLVWTYGIDRWCAIYCTVQWEDKFIRV